MDVSRVYSGNGAALMEILRLVRLVSHNVCYNCNLQSSRANRHGRVKVDTWTLAEPYSSRIWVLCSLVPETRA